MLLCVAHTLHTCNSSSHKTRSPHLSPLLLFLVLDVGSHSSSTIQRGPRGIRQSFSSIPKEKNRKFLIKVHPNAKCSFFAPLAFSPPVTCIPRQPLTHNVTRPFSPIRSGNETTYMLRPREMTLFPLTSNDPCGSAGSCMCSGRNCSTVHTAWSS